MSGASTHALVALALVASALVIAVFIARVRKEGFDTATQRAAYTLAVKASNKRRWQSCVSTCDSKTKGKQANPVCIQRLGLTMPDACYARCTGLSYSQGACAAGGQCGCPDLMSPSDTKEGRVCLTAAGTDALPRCHADCWGLSYTPGACPRG